MTWLLNWDRPSTSQYCRWIAEIEQFDFEIEHRKGNQHINADALSRLEPCSQCEIKHTDTRPKRNVKVFQIGKLNKANRDIVEKYHREMGHIGMTKLVDVLQISGHTWKVLVDDVKFICNECIFCAERKTAPIGKYHTHAITTFRPFEKIIMDISGPFS